MRKRALILVIIAVFIGALATAVKFLVLDRNSNVVSALQIDAFPKSEVYLDDKRVGQTPYSNDELKPGEYKLKLIATGVTGSFLPWESKVKLVDNSRTYISRELAADDSHSAGQILWLEKLPSDKESELAVVSSPDQSEVTIDGLSRGLSTIILSDLISGDHEVKISKTGFADQIIKGRINKGYRLNAVVKLAKFDQKEISQPTLSQVASPSASADREKTSSPSGAVDSMDKPYVIIKDTNTGFLRVRMGPTTSSTEITRVKPGEKYPLLDESSGWAQIKLDATTATGAAVTSGWVSEIYVEKIK